MPRAATDDRPVLAFAFALGSVGAEAVQRQVIVAYDEIFAIKYYGKKLLPYWARNGVKIAGAVADRGAKTTPRLSARCEAFDGELMADMTRLGGEQYAADHGAGLSPMRGRQRAGRRRQPAAAAVHQGKHQQRRHRHGGRLLSHGPDLDPAQPDAGQGLAGPRADVRRLAALEVPQRPARPGHLSHRHRPGRRRRGDARRGKRQHADPLRRHRAGRGQRRLRRPLVAAADPMGEVPGEVRPRPGERSFAPTISWATWPTTPTSRSRRSWAWPPTATCAGCAATRQTAAKYFATGQGRRRALDEGRRRRRPLPAGLRQAGHLEPEVQPGVGPHPRAERLSAVGRAKGNRPLQEGDAPLRRAAG